jgi:hypothetical protein
VLIEPIMPWLVALADQVKRTSEQYTYVSAKTTTNFKTNSLMFVRSRDAFWYSFNYVGMESRLWQWGWILNDTQEIYDCLSVEEQNDLILRDGVSGEYTGDVQPVILTECYALLQQFNPREWAAKIERVVTMQILKFRPHNMLWTQILLLDVAIHFLVRGGFHEGSTVGYNLWEPEVVAVFNAIVHVWDPTAEERAAANNTDSDSEGSSMRSSRRSFIPPPPRAAAASKAEQDHVETLKEHATPLVEGFGITKPTSEVEGDGTAPVTSSPLEDADSAPPADAHTHRDTTTPPPPPPMAEDEDEDGDEALPPNPPTPTKKPPLPSRTHSSSLDVEWDLAGSLRKQVHLFPDLDRERREAKVQKLAVLLQLRALFVIALFILMPDSSDVYLADGERVEMPMI